MISLAQAKSWFDVHGCTWELEYSLECKHVHTKITMPDGNSASACDFMLAVEKLMTLVKEGNR
jgi:hypothetical protein